jgi:adenylate kinase
VNVLLLGPQGSGKGTQAKRIEAEYGIPHIATGDMLRAAIEQGTELGRRVKPILESGRLDGFPRTPRQADALDAMLEDIGRGLSIVFEFQLPDEVARERLQRRSELEGRADDTPEAIAKRLALYHDQTEPLVGHYRLQGNLVGIHGDRSIDEVFSEVQEALEQVTARS